MAAHPVHGDIGDVYQINVPSIYRENLNAAEADLVESNVGNRNIMEITLSFGANFETVAIAAQIAVGNGDISARGRGRCLKCDRVIAGVDATV